MGEEGRGEFDSSTSHTRFSDKYRAEGRKKMVENRQSSLFSCLMNFSNY